MMHLLDCGPFFDLWICIPDGVFDHPEYVDESAYVKLTFKDASLTIPLGLVSPWLRELWGLLEWEIKDGHHYSSWCMEQSSRLWPGSVTVIGTALGSSYLRSKGWLDFLLLVAMFIGIFAAQFHECNWQKDQNHAHVLLAVAVSSFLLLFCFAN